jgi:hypothetical protein
MADPQIGFGTQLQRGTTVASTPTAFTAVAAVFDLSGPELTRDDVQVTNYLSTNRYHEYVPGMREAGSITATLNRLSTEQTQWDLFNSTAGSSAPALGSFESNVDIPWRIVGPNSDYWEFRGYVSGIAQAQPIDDRRTLEVTIKITGQPTFGHTT